MFENTVGSAVPIVFVGTFVDDVLGSAVPPEPVGTLDVDEDIDGPAVMETVGLVVVDDALG